MWHVFCYAIFIFATLAFAQDPAALGQKPVESASPQKKDEFDQYRVKAPDASKLRKDASSTVKRCRELSGLSGSALDGFPDSSVTKLTEIRTNIYACLDSYVDLTKSQVASLGILLGWTQYLIDHGGAAGTAQNTAGEKKNMSTDSSETPQSDSSETPQLSTGKISLFPLDMGQTFSFLLDRESLSCKATSIQQLDCSAGSVHRYFSGAIAEQNGHEYLLGCVPAFLSETCMGLSAGMYTVLVHSRSVTVLDSGMVRINSETGKTLGPLTPVFSILSLLE